MTEKGSYGCVHFKNICLRWCIRESQVWRNRFSLGELKKHDSSPHLVVIPQLWQALIVFVRGTLLIGRFPVTSLFWDLKRSICYKPFFFYPAKYWPSSSYSRDQLVNIYFPLSFNWRDLTPKTSLSGQKYSPFKTVL